MPAEKKGIKDFHKYTFYLFINKIKCNMFVMPNNNYWLRELRVC